MTDRIHALTVILDRDIRDDDVQPLIDAIRQLRGVGLVEPTVATTTDYLARARVAIELHSAVHKAVADVFEKYRR